MNNELFDSIIREQLAQQAVTPSAGVKKVLTKKLFFQNLWIFHKIKLLVTAVGVSAAAITTVYFINQSGEETKTQVSNLADGNNNKIWVNQQEIIVQPTTELSQNNLSDHTDFTESDNQLTNSDDALSTGANEDKNNFNSTNPNSLLQDKAPNNNNNKKNHENKKNKGTLDIIGTESENDPLPFKNEITYSGEATKESNSNKLSDNLYTSIQYQEPLAATNQPVLLNLELDTALGKKPLMGDTKPFIYKELSFDIFSNVQNQGLITNEMINETYKTYYWDFYADQVERKMPTTFGAAVNMAIGTYRHKFTISSGLNYTKMEESKTKYDFNEVVNEAWLDLFEVSEFSWVNTYGQDTCTTCFYARATDELKNEIQEEYNRYTYVNVPLQVGYNLNLGVVSVGVKGGVQTSILGNAKGLYSKKSIISQGEQLYFWKGLEMTTLGRENDMLKPVYFSYMLGGEVKLRLTSKVDLMVGYNYIKSAGSFTKEDYLYSKKYTNQSIQVGCTFYTNRIPILKKLIF